MSCRSASVGDPHDSAATMHDRASICQLDVMVVQPWSPKYDDSDFHRKDITEDVVIISADSKGYPTVESHW